MRRGLICLLLLIMAAVSAPAYALTMTPTWNLSTDAWPTTNFKLQTTYLPPSSGDTAYVQEGNGGTAGTTQQFAQTFAPTSNFTLTGIAVTIGGSPIDITLALYYCGPDDSNWATPASIDFTTQTKLWEETVSFSGSAGETVVKFDFSGTDLIDVNSGDSYALVITGATTTQNQLIWYRSGAAAYNGGQMYRGTGTLDTLSQIASWGSRQGGLAVYGVNIPGQAASPSPADEDTGVSLAPTLSWTADTDATTHEVYLGTDFNDVNNADVNDANVFQGNLLGTTYAPDILASNTTYYWRIDEKNVLGTTAGDVWSFTTANVLPLTITKCTVKAGKTQGADADDVNNIKDSITLSGTATFPADANQITQLDINIISVDDNEIIFSQTIDDFNSYLDSKQKKHSYSHKIPKYTLGGITSLKMDFVKGTFSLTAKNVDLTGLGGNVKLELTMNELDVVLSGQADETIVNGRKRIQTRLMRMYQDTLIVTNAKAKHSTTPLSDSLSVTGEIAIEDINNTDMNEPNLAVLDVNFVWGDQVFAVGDGNFVAAKTGHKYSCKNVLSDVNEGMVTAKFDLDKCTFTVSVKEANNLYALPDYPDVNFSMNYGIGDANDFNEPAEVNLVTRRSY